jgi:hypothetical protein
LKQRYFPRKKKVTTLQLRDFSETYFGKHGGYAQQYLFHHARMALRKSGVARDSSTSLRSARNDSGEGTRVASRKSGITRDSSRPSRKATAWQATPEAPGAARPRADRTLLMRPESTPPPRRGCDSESKGHGKRTVRWSSCQRPRAGILFQP